ncbi:hypothetical protein SY83_02100 [Paenibacillus swuensis]|uniref:HTH araC/xylS-type domain-containing protein n=1 Tax=Paenibacillus swuensis TaxID=1178515 RepID=A0A172TE57_9BACL|nr:AraC family transcriptional regulator [Paenibacillus swuensis]ANE45321.1 hypothetical protein SY83_02100 [Paenibacillus swuensis]
MKNLKEPIYYQSPLLSLKVSSFVVSHGEQTVDRPWHYHKELEFILVRQGHLECLTTEQVYTLNQGDVLLLGSSQLHHTRKIGDQTLDHIVLHIDLESYYEPAMMMYFPYFSELHAPLSVLNYIFQENQLVKEEISRTILLIYEEMHTKTIGYEMAANMHVRQLLLLLLRSDHGLKLRGYDRMDAAIFRQVTDFIDDHLSDKIEMERVCSLVNMSYSYFSRYFKQAVGMSFTEFVNLKRIKKAERLLVTKKSSITEIASLVGIENMAHFYKLFKRFNGCTPKEYMNRLRTRGGLPQVISNS